MSGEAAETLAPSFCKTVLGKKAKFTVFLTSPEYIVANMIPKGQKHEWEVFCNKNHSQSHQGIGKTKARARSARPDMPPGQCE